MPYPYYMSNQPSHIAMSSGLEALEARTGLNLHLQPDMSRAQATSTKPAAKPAGAVNSWTGKDKVAHFGVSFAFGCAAAAAVDNPYVAFGLAMIPGLGKEIHDGQRPNNPDFSAKDLAVDALGAATGVVACHALKEALTAREDPTNNVSASYYKHAMEEQTRAINAVVIPGPRSLQAAVNYRF